MMDACGGLLMFLFAIALIVGTVNGLWVICRAMFGANSTPDRPQRRPPSQTSAGPADADDAAAWTAAERQLRRLHNRGLLSERLYRQMRSVLRSERERSVARTGGELSEAIPDVASLELPEVAEQATPETPGTERLDLELPPVETPPVSSTSDVPLEILDFEEPEPAAGEPEGVSPRRTPVAHAHGSPETATESEPVPAVVAEPPRTRDWGGLLQAFMDEKNIRWGELVSGMLIVGSAIGLVISLWATLQKSIPYFPALLFMLGTAAIHGAGVYTLRRWNLKSTSRGLLLISTLLIPLNFLAAIALSAGGGGEGPRPVTDPLYIVAVIVGMLSYGAIAYSASRIFRKQLWWTMWPAVMLPSIGQLIISRQASPERSVEFLNALALLPLLGFALPIAMQLQIASRGVRFPQRRATETFRLLGIGLFSLLMALGLLVAQSGDMRLTLAALSPVVSIIAVMVTATGLLIHRRAVRAELAVTRTAGTTIALFGAAVMLVGLALAWPRPELLVAVGLVDVAALVILALTARLPALHVPAIAAAALTTLTAVHWAQGTLLAGPDASSIALIDALLMGRSSLVLLGIGALCVVGMRGWRFAGREEDALCYLWGAAGLGAVSLLVAFYAGFFAGVDAALTTPVFVLAAVAALAVCRMDRQAWAAVAGGVLLFVSFYHAFVFNEPVMNWLAAWSLDPRDPFVLALLLTATITGLFALIVSRRSGIESTDEAERLRFRERVIVPLVGTAFLASVFAIPQVLAAPLDGIPVHTGYLFWIACLWGASAATLRSREALLGAQLASFVAVGYAAVAVSQRFDWWAENGFADARYWQIQIGMQAVWCSAWALARRFLPTETDWAIVFGKRQLGVDHFVLGGLVLAVSILGMSGVTPGLLAEFRPSENAAIDLTRDAPDRLTLFLTVGLFAAALFATSFASMKRAAAGVFFGGLAAVVLTTVVVRSASLSQAVAHPDHAAMFGSTMWIVLALVAVGVAATFWDRVTTPAICGLVGLSGLIPVQIATQFGGALTTASWLRWGLAGYAAAVFAGMTFQRWRSQGFPKSLGSGSPLGSAAPRLEAVRTVGFSVSLWPLLMLTLVAFAVGFDAPTALAHSDGVAAIFREIGPSYAVPLWILAAVFLASAVVERKATFVLAASVLIQLGVTVLFVLPVWQTGESLGGTGLIELIQWSALTLGACTLLWMAGRKWIEDVAAEPSADDVLASPFGVQLWWTTATIAILPLWAAFAIVLSPERFAPLISQIGDWKGFAALGMAAVAAVAALRNARAHSRLDVVGCLAIVLVPMIAAAATRLDDANPWLAYHVLLGGWGAVMLGVATAAAVVTWRSQGFQKSLGSETPGFSIVNRAMSWALPLAGVVVLLGIRAQWDDPQRPWWLVGAASAAALTTILFGLLRRQQVFACVSGGLVLLATTAALSHPWIGLADAPTTATTLNVLQANLIALAGIGLFWLGVQLFWQRRDEDFDPQSGALAAHHAAGGIGLLVTAVMAVVMLFARSAGESDLVIATPMGWAVVASLAALLCGSLWDRRAGHALPALYALGLVAAVVGLDSRDFSLRMTWYGIGAIAAAYVLTTGLLWWQRRAVREAASRSGIPNAAFSESGIGAWLSTANVCLAVFAVGIHFWAVLSFTGTDELRFRLGAAFATALLVPAFVCFADEERGPALRFLSLSTAVVAVLLGVWSLPQTDFMQIGFPVDPVRAMWLERMIRLLEVASVATLLYAVGAWKLLKPESGWGRTMRNVAVTAGGVGLAALFLVLGMEGLLFVPKQVPITTAQIVVVSVILVGLAGGLIVLAVAPGRDPLHLSERGRMGYVYAAELVASLLFLHIYLTKPVLFGMLRPYWPYIVIGIAYVGVGLAEWFRRLKLQVLSEPLRWTATFLPLLPALAFLTALERRDFDEYSLLLFLAGLAYVVLATLRKSFGYALAAAFVGNMALWSLLHHYETEFLTRPQLWLIPPALSVLVAGQLNRKRLSDAQLTALRYLCVMMIYVSSTGEMFITGAGESIEHPMILATLSIAGVLAGMLMRIRAFLYLGTSFLFLSIVSMVWHATRAIDHVWPWWVFGIVLGIAILAMFGVFEKKRNEVLRVVGRLREWER